MKQRPPVMLVLFSPLTYTGHAYTIVPAERQAGCLTSSSLLETKFRGGGDQAPETSKPLLLAGQLRRTEKDQRGWEQCRSLGLAGRRGRAHALKPSRPQSHLSQKQMSGKRSRQNQTVTIPPG